MARMGRETQALTIILYIITAHGYCVGVIAVRWEKSRKFEGVLYLFFVWGGSVPPTRLSQTRAQAPCLRYAAPPSAFSIPRPGLSSLLFLPPTDRHIRFYSTPRKFTKMVQNGTHAWPRHAIRSPQKYRESLHVHKPCRPHHVVKSPLGSREAWGNLFPTYKKYQTPGPFLRNVPF